MTEHVQAYGHQPWGRETAPAPIRREPFIFYGTAGEYFGIWIVNILLTILTLGIYSAWAKVRRMRYFYGNTELAGASFEYHARPTQILIGRIIVLVLLIAYNAAVNLLGAAGLIFVPLFILAMPWFIYRGIRFSARVTSYRNVRFDFKGGYGGALMAYLIGPFVATLSLGILVPHASRWLWRYQLDNLTYGGRPVASDPRLGAFYRQWLAPAIATVVFIIVVPVIFLTALSVTGLSDSAGNNDPLGYDAADKMLFVLAFMYPLLVAALLVYSLIGMFYQAGARNVAFNSTVIDARHRLVSFVGRRRYVWIGATNLLATIFSLGLARPWAAVRMAKYLAATTALDVDGRLDDFVSSIKDTGSATGSEFMDFEGFDLGF